MAAPAARLQRGERDLQVSGREGGREGRGGRRRGPAVLTARSGGPAGGQTPWPAMGDRRCGGAAVVTASSAARGAAPGTPSLPFPPSVSPGLLPAHIARPQPATWTARGPRGSSSELGRAIPGRLPPAAAVCGLCAGLHCPVGAHITPFRTRRSLPAPRISTLKCLPSTPIAGTPRLRS